MDGFTTSKDRMLKATGAESEIDWSQVPATLLQTLLATQQNGNTGVVTPQTTTCYPYQTTNDKTIIIAGHVYQLTEALQMISVALQLISIIITLVIAGRISR